MAGGVTWGTTPARSSWPTSSTSAARRSSAWSSRTGNCAASPPNWPGSMNSMSSRRCRYAGIRAERAVPRARRGSVEAAVRPGPVSPVVDGRRDRADRPARRVHAVADGLPGFPDAAEAAGGPGERADHDLLPGLRHRARLATRRGGHRHRHPRDRQPARARGPAAGRTASAHRGVPAPPRRPSRGRSLTHPRLHDREQFWANSTGNCSRSWKRQADGHTQARPGVAEAHRTTVGLGRGPHDGQAEAGALLARAITCLVQASEATEGPFGIFGGNPWPVVGYGEHGPPAVV